MTVFGDRTFKEVIKRRALIQSDSGPYKKRKFGHTKSHQGDLPGIAVVENPPANAGDTGSSPGPGRSHMPRRN